VRRVAVLILLTAGCKFDPPASLPISDGAMTGDGAGGDGQGDGAAIDGAPTDARPPDASVDAPACPATYTAATSSTRYRFVESITTWLGAEQDCEDDGFGTHLMVIDETAEEDLVDALSNASRTWIGASDRANEGTWRWVTGASSASLGSTPNVDCGYYYLHPTDGTPGPQEADCDTANAYLCECDLTPADPTAY
jgi:hypothetical protein